MQSNRAAVHKHVLRSIPFDRRIAASAMDGFSASCDVPCTLHLSDGTVLRKSDNAHSTCSFCRAMLESIGKAPPCESLHVNASVQAEKIGGRYIYSCQAGLVFIASPIMIEGVRSGFMTAGPIGMPDTEDLLDATLYHKFPQKGQLYDAIKKKISNIRCAYPDVVEALSGQMFATCLYISDSMHEMYLAGKDIETESQIFGTAVSLKHDDSVSYPLEKEMELYYAVSEGNRERASEHLNELLGFILFYYDSREEIYARTAQLLTVLSRAAISGGANSENILSACNKYIIDLQNISTRTDLARWMAISSRRFINLVFELTNGDHTGSMQHTISYIKDNCTEKITLEEVAELAGYSPTYYSRIFKEEVGESFKSYLMRMRVEKSKVFLLTTKLPMADVCVHSGFSDQSYFCKVFKQYEGVSPDKFRKRTRRIDTSKEKSKDE